MIDIKGSEMTNGQNRDPLGEKTDRNLYRFVMNNALSYFDPYGLDLIGLPGLTRYQLVPQPPPLQLPPPPIPPGVNVPPPCAPYPECAHPPSSHIPGSYSQCLDWCSNKLKVPLPTPVKHLGTGIGLACKVAERSPKWLPILAAPGVWDMGSYSGCAFGCLISNPFDN